MVCLSACTSSRHVPEGEYLLDKVSVRVDSCGEKFDNTELLNYLRQRPNHKMLWAIKFRLGIFNMSGTDTTKWWNRWVRKMGEAPVVYSPTLTLQGADQLKKMLENKGYLHAGVRIDTIADSRKRKISVAYTLTPGESHTIRSVTYDFPNDSILRQAIGDSSLSALIPGDRLDRSLLEAERDRIITRLRNRGYYRINKEDISFVADTTGGSLEADLTLRLQTSRLMPDTVMRTDREYMVRRVIYITDFDPSAVIAGEGGFQAADTISYKGLEIVNSSRAYLRPGVLYENCFITPGMPYRERDVERTYKALSRLEILKYVNIRFREVGTVGDVGFLDAYILLTPGKSQSCSLELEGTNSEGDFGVAVGIAYKHRNVGKGSETLSLKLTGAYEAISGKIEGLIHNRYMEYSLEGGISFPKFKAPFLRESFKRKINAITDINLSINYQERPEYTRIISTAGWSYKWTERLSRNRHTFTPLDINYVFLPESTNDFIDKIAPDNPLLRYSYEDHFIMRLGYSFYHTNKRPASPWRRDIQKDIYTIRVNAETAGNLLYAINNIFTPHPHPTENPYKIFGIHYSQYVRVEGDFGFLHIFDERNSIAAHVGLGVGYPYGNSRILPFEKRFFGGGANGVRGWDVRTLGPGSYHGNNSVSDFINQCGDIRFDMSVEYRAKLFWIIELGLFLDAGNIWTIHSYPNQPGGMFHFNSFYKQLAAAYGAGIRLDFDYFLIRFDLGMKAHNPATGAEPWPLIHPRWHRDSSFHFSIGYPF